MRCGRVRAYVKTELVFVAVNHANIHVQMSARTHERMERMLDCQVGGGDCELNINVEKEMEPRERRMDERS